MQVRHEYHDVYIERADHAPLEIQSVAIAAALTAYAMIIVTLTSGVAVVASDTVSVAWHRFESCFHIFVDGCYMSVS